VASAINPLGIEPGCRFSLYLLTAMVALVLLFMRTGWRVSRIEGLVLLSISAARWWHDMGGCARFGFGA
jgi:cation:H+ antiporter